MLAAAIEYELMCDLFHVDRLRDLYARDDPNKWDTEERLTVCRLFTLLITGAAKWKAYARRIRSLIFNLKHSPELARRLPTIDVAWLVRAPPQELWPERWQGCELPAHLQCTIITTSDLVPMTSAFTCGKCRGNRTTYAQAQTRSADEPMTVFIQCINGSCGNRWKI